MESPELYVYFVPILWFFYFLYRKRQHKMAIKNNPPMPSLEEVAEMSLSNFGQLKENHYYTVHADTDLGIYMACARGDRFFPVNEFVSFEEANKYSSKSSHDPEGESFIFIYDSSGAITTAFHNGAELEKSPH